MCGNKNNRGFTLLEIIIVIGIIGMLGAVAVPNLRDKSPKQVRTAFIAELNTITSRAWFNGITKDTIQRVVFDFQKNTISIEEQVEKNVPRGQEPQFKLVKKANFDTTMGWPKEYHVKNFFIEGNDEAAEFRGGTFEKTWFYIMPNGLAQDVAIVVLDKSASKQGALFKIVLNPFSVQFKEVSLQKRT